MNPYIGHESQMARVEEHRLVEGRGDGMRIIEVDNGMGLSMTLLPDRCLDISRLSFRGMNMVYFGACGYVAPTYYDLAGDGFLRNFTAGFLTTCGLQSVGGICVDAGEELPMHGSIGNTPAEHVYWTRDADAFHIHAVIIDARIFTRKLRLERCITVSLRQNTFEIADTIVNEGHREEPIELLYHMNMGYPLLDEDSVVFVNSNGRVAPRDAHAAEDLKNWMHMEKPQAGYQERCYYHTCEKEGIASIFQPKHGLGLSIHFDTESLDHFTEWKMMGQRDYVLGFEPGNCNPDGRDVMRSAGKLKFLPVGGQLNYGLRVEMLTENPVK